jgi:hypothetical protein
VHTPAIITLVFPKDVRETAAWWQNNGYNQGLLGKAKGDHVTAPMVITKTFVKGFMGDHGDSVLSLLLAGGEVVDPDEAGQELGVQ